MKQSKQTRAKKTQDGEAIEISISFVVMTAGTA